MIADKQKWKGLLDNLHQHKLILRAFIKLVYASVKQILEVLSIK